MISRETKITLSQWEIRVIEFLVTEGKITVNILRKSRGNRLLVCVSARFKLSRVRVIKSQMYLNLPLQVWTRC